MPATLSKNGDTLELDLSSCRGTEFADTLAKIKEVAGRKYDGDRKLWLAPADGATAEQIMSMIRPDASPELHAWIKEQRVAETAELTTPLPDDAELTIPLGEKLYGFQRAFIDHAVERLRLVLADDMGLGKTVQALGAVAEYEARDDVGGPKLIVAPNSVKGAWKREILKWLGDQPVYVVEGTPAKREDQLREAAEQDGWAIVNWEQLRVERKRLKTKNGGERTVTVMKQPLFESTPWLAVIADEAHRAKNRKASQSMGLHRIDANLMIAATGTPIMNSPDELWSLLKWMWPKEYTSYWRFYDQYVEYHESYYGKVITGVKNPDALRFELRDRLVRRTKDQVLDLPDKIRVLIPVELGSAQRALYKKAEKEMWLEVIKDAEEGSPTAVAMLKAGQEGDVTTMYRIPNGAARMVRQRQILESPALLEGKDESAKLDACVERILDAVDHQHVVFCEFVETTAILAERLRAKGLEVATYTGSVKPAERTAIEDAFQNGEYSVIVGTIAAMKEGITLTAADIEHFISRSWVPATNEQAEDRCHRVGQHRPVVINIYEAENTVDTLKVSPTNELKDRIVRAVLPKDNVKEERNGA